MNVEEIRKYCLSFPGVTENIKWENHLCFCVGEKMFFVVNPDSHPVNGSFKTSDEHFEELITKEGLIPAPYLAKHKWVYFNGFHHLSTKEWKYFSKLAYQLVFDKLSAKLRKQING
jgi:predicted DNA-binding protein (MmcQ/YjbR family)